MSKTVAFTFPGGATASLKVTSPLVVALAGVAPNHSGGPHYSGVDLSVEGTVVETTAVSSEAKGIFTLTVTRFFQVSATRRWKGVDGVVREVRSEESYDLGDLDEGVGETWYPLTTILRRGSYMLTARRVVGTIPTREPTPYDVRASCPEIGSWIANRGELDDAHPCVRVARPVAEGVVP